MAVTSLLAPRPGRWPGDPRRAAAAAARQHPEVHPAALPPAARAGAWGRVRPGRAGPGRAGVLPSAAEGGQLGTCGAAPARSPRGLEKRACGAREDAGDVFAGSPHFLPREPISPPTTQSVTREMGGLCFSPWVPRNHGVTGNYELPQTGSKVRQVHCSHSGHSIFSLDQICPIPRTSLSRSSPSGRPRATSITGVGPIHNTGYTHQSFK